MTAVKRGKIGMTLALLAAMLPGGCSELTADESGNSRSMAYSGGQFGRGYNDGLREAKDSLMDEHAGWLWLWAMDKEYAKGYERGWSDGRRMAALEKQPRNVERPEPQPPADQE